MQIICISYEYLISYNSVQETHLETTAYKYKYKYTINAIS